MTNSNSLISWLDLKPSVRRTSYKVLAIGGPVNRASMWSWISLTEHNCEQSWFVHCWVFLWQTGQVAYEQYSVSVTIHICRLMADLLNWLHCRLSPYVSRHAEIEHMHVWCTGLPTKAENRITSSGITVDSIHPMPGSICVGTKASVTMDRSITLLQDSRRIT